MSDNSMITQAAIHIELTDATIKSIKHQAGKAVWTIEVRPDHQNTNLADMDTVLGDGYKAQVVIEAEYEEPVDKEAVDPRQGKLADWSKE